jgi:hypothetical protein
MPLTIEPEPPDGEREAILAALEAGEEAVLGGWERAALAEGVENDEPDP